MDLEEKIIRVGEDVDEDDQVTPSEARRIIRRVDFRLVLATALGYSVSLMDRGNISLAAIAGMLDDLNFVGYRYSTTVLAFFITYAAFQAPATAIIRKIGPPVFLFIIVLCWGILMLGMGLTSISGLGNFLQPGLDTLTFKIFHRNPIPVNITLTAMTAITGTALAVYIWTRSHVFDISSQDEESWPIDGQGVNGKPSYQAISNDNRYFARGRENNPCIQTSSQKAVVGVRRNQENIPLPSGESSAPVPGRGDGQC